MGSRRRPSGATWVGVGCLAVAATLGLGALRSGSASPGEIQRIVPATLVTPAGSPAAAVRVTTAAECIVTRHAVIGRVTLTSRAPTPTLEMGFALEAGRGARVVMSPISIDLSPGERMPYNVVVWGDPATGTDVRLPHGAAERCYLTIRAPGDQLPAG